METVIVAPIVDLLKASKDKIKSDYSLFKSTRLMPKRHGLQVCAFWSFSAFTQIKGGGRGCYLCAEKSLQPIQPLREIASH
jgi:hypothetical protein